MAFGDLIASLGLQLFKEKGCDIAESKGEVSQESIAKVRNDMFVDDGSVGIAATRRRTSSSGT